jgi:hypothetical protein
MRKDLIKKVESSFLSCEKDTETILKKLFVETRPYSDILKKLLVINTKDCLTADKKEYEDKIKSMNISDLREQGYILLEPNINFGEHEEVKSYLIISFDNFVPNENNPEYRDCTVNFDIICHTKYWDIGNYQMRPLKIVGYIDGILNNAKLSGIGTFNFMRCGQLILDENLSGYTLTYSAIHDVDGDDKIPNVQ